MSALCREDATYCQISLALVIIIITFFITIIIIKTTFLLNFNVRLSTQIKTDRIDAMPVPLCSKSVAV